MKKLLQLSILMLIASRSFATCSGSGLTWSCTAGTTVAQVNTVIGSMSDGATITFAAGSYTWASTISLNAAKGVTLICSGTCTVTASGTVFAMPTWSGINTKLFRISGFNFPNTPDFLIWFGSGGSVNGTLTQVRVDHNNFTTASAESHIIVLGENSSVVNVYGVIDHNVFSGSSSIEALYMLAAVNNAPPASQFGTINNMFFEDNTVTSTNMTDAGLGCTDGWGGLGAVVRHNTFTNCLVTFHGVTHAGGPGNVELYDNHLIANGNSTFPDGYRMFHHQGSGEYISFNNIFTASGSPKNTSANEVIHYRDYCPNSIDGGLPCCDGTQSRDANRQPLATYRGYPCWRQPGRDFFGNAKPMYSWNNYWSNDNAQVLLASPDYAISSPDYWAQHMKANREYYNAVSANAQTTASSPFNGTTGMGFGTLALRPTTCTTGPEAGVGVAYFATNSGAQGTLYVCTATNTWTSWYQPFTYPHPLTTGGAVLPSVTTAAASSITTTTATSGGNVTSDGGASVSARGLCYAVTSNPTTPCTSDGTGTGAFTSSLSGLTPNTIYHTRAFATNSAGTAYGLDVAFTTLPLAPTLPTVFTTAATGMTQTTAVSGGNVTSDGGASVTGRGVCRSITVNPTTSDTCTSNGTGIGSFVANLSGMTASTTYHIRAFATNSVGTAYGTDLTFRTLDPVVVLPTVTTTAASNIQQTTATAGGTVLTDGGATVSARGTCIATTLNPVVGGTCTSDGTGTGVFVSSLTGLSDSTLYFIRAFATNSAGTAYGSNLSFTTQAPAPVVPTLTTTTATAITQTTASSGGNISSDGGAAVTDRGVCYTTTVAPTTPCTSNGTGIGAFTSPISGLSAGTVYFYRAFATNSAGTGYGNQLSFTTLNPLPVLPTVSTTAASSIGQTTATAGGNVISAGGGIVTARGTCYAITANPTTPCTSNGSGTGSFTSSITGLSNSTLYHIRAFATNSAGTGYGSDLTFTTQAPSPVAPTLTTTAASAITQTTASAGGNISSDGGASVTARGTCYAVMVDPTTPCTSNGTGIGAFSSSISGLIAGTLYHIRAFATNSAGTTYGSDLTFTTLIPPPVLPTVSTTAVSTITQTTATTGGNISTDGGATVTSRGVCYATTLNPTTPCTSNGTGTGSFVSSLVGLTASTLYHIRAFATNSVGTAYGSDLTFTTDSPPVLLPTVTTTAASSIAQTTATSGGTVTSDGGATVSSRGVCYATTLNPTSPCTSNGTGTGAFTSPITGLLASTLYHVRAFAVNSVGTSYGQDLTFTTANPPVILPTVTTTAASNIQLTTATAGGNVTSAGGGAISARGTCYGTSANPMTGGTCTSDGTGTGVFVSSISGLSDSTLYHIRAFATNSAGTAYGPDLTFTTQTPAPTVPVLITTPSSNVTQTTASAGGNISSDGGAAVTARGTCWGLAANPTTGPDCTSDGSGIGSFTSSITGLTAGTLYHFRAFATNSVGTAYGADLTFTTGIPSPGLPTLVTLGVSQISQTTATGGGLITSDGGAPVTVRGICYALTANPTTSGTCTTNGTGLGQFSSPISGLSASTTYHVRAYATNSVGTAYGADVSFTTSSGSGITGTTFMIAKAREQ